MAKANLEILLENANATGKANCAQQNFNDAPGVVPDEYCWCDCVGTMGNTSKMKRCIFVRRGVSAIHGGGAIYVICHIIAQNKGSTTRRKTIYFCSKVGKYRRRDRSSETYKDNALKPRLVPGHRVLLPNPMMG